LIDDWVVELSNGSPHVFCVGFQEEVVGVRKLCRHNRGCDVRRLSPESHRLQDLLRRLRTRRMLVSVSTSAIFFLVYVGGKE